MEVIETEKGKPCALYNGHSYRRFRENKLGVVTWVCLKDKSLKCRGRLLTVNDAPVKVSEHVCVPDDVSVDVKRAVFSAKKRVREDRDLQIRQIYDQEFQSLRNRGYDRLPKFKNLKSTLYLNRNQAQKKQPEDKNILQDSR